LIGRSSFNSAVGVSSPAALVLRQEVNSIRQDEHETLEILFKNTDLSFAQKSIHECFHISGPGRPPRNPLGLLRTFIVMRMKGIRSLREMARMLNTDPRLRRLCLIKKNEKGYPRTVLSRFTNRVGVEKLTSIIEEKVINLLKQNQAGEVDAILDATFIKAWSTRHPLDSHLGYSDVEARVGRTGRSYDLGYKLHISIDHERRLPLASILAPANENEKKHCPTLLEKTRQLLTKAGTKLRTVIADSQYSSKKVRESAPEAIIPYPANQRRGVKNLLRVDRKFRTHGPEDQKNQYHKRSSVEAVNSFLKTQFSAAINKVRGLKQVTTYALYSLLSLVLIREAAVKTGKQEKAVSPTYFNT